MDECDVYWRVISGENVTKFYGHTDSSRVYDIDEDGRKRIYSWLISGSIDPFGNAINYIYKSENAECSYTTDGDGAASIGISAREGTMSQRMKHIKTIQYGNRTPSRDLDSWAVGSYERLEYMFSIVIDYGEHDNGNPSTDEKSIWYYRQDPFSSFNSGFELRTRRLAQRILMFHHIPEKLTRKDYLVVSLELKYNEKRAGSFLASAILCGHVAQNGGGYQTQRSAPHSFSYSHTSTLKDLALKQVNGPDFSGFTGLSKFRTEWVDLDGEGCQGHLAMSDMAWYYQRNEMVIHSADRAPFAPSLPLDKIPNFQSESPFYFEDLGKTGFLDIVNVDGHGRVEGFMEREDNGWSDYKTFRTITNTAFPKMETQKLDLTGNGFHDVFYKINDSDTITWQQSLGKEGFGEPQRVKNAAKLPDLAPKDPNTAFYCCDMSGDGLADLVQISNGKVSYWPNLGYGRFGSERLMMNSPVFDGCNFDPTRLRIGDIDGSGTTDLIYLPAGGGAHVYFNEAGNSWTTKNTIRAFPNFDSTSSVYLLDLLSNGTSCLCWNGPGTAQPNSILYLDLMSGIKPNLLVGYSNGLGLSLAVEYKPSTWFYMNDLHQGSPWLTKLPFPVQCVSKVENCDQVALTRLTTRYAYRDGFYDRLEREFRGFAMTETWDAEEYCTTREQNGSAILDRPPLHTKTWWHTGAMEIGSNLSNAFSHPQLAPSVLPQKVQQNEYAQVARALKGRQLRTETFSDDLTEKANIPYEVVEHNYKVVRIQSPNDQNDSIGIYRVDSCETVRSFNERDLQDPRQEHSIHLEFNTFGQETKSIAIKYGISASEATDINIKKQQEENIILFNEITYTEGVVDKTDDLRLPQVSAKRQHRILNVESTTFPFKLQDFLRGGRLDISAMPDVLIGAMTDSTLKEPYMVLLADARTRYLPSNLSTPLPFGSLEAFSVVDTTFTLAMTPEMYSNAYGAEDILKDCCIADARESGGYTDLDGKWWKTLEKSYYADPKKDQLAPARSSFYSPCVTVDPFKTESNTTLDQFYMMPLCQRDTLGNETSFENDYRTFQPWQVTNINGNRSQTYFDAFGYVSAIAVLGKEDEAIGDSLEGIPDILSQQALDDFIEDPIRQAPKLLCNAGTVILRDMNTFQQSPPKPTWQATIQRDVHFREGASQFMVNIVYYDAHGKPLQELSLRDSTSTPSWLISGWEVRDNKGTVVRKFQPSISESHSFVPQVNMISPCTTFILDPLERVVGILHSDYTWEKVEEDSWSKTLYDAGDTISMECWKDPIMFNPLSRGTLDKITWLSGRTSINSSGWDKDSAEKSLIYQNTPTVCHYDASGRIVLEVRDKSSKNISTRYTYDLFGNKSSIIDGLNRTVEETYFDYLGRPLRTAGMDSGYRWSIFDCNDKPLVEWNTKGIRKAHIYDPLRRPVGTWMSEKADKRTELLVTKVVYGEAVEPIVESNRRNRRGEIVEIYDQAGVLSNLEFDFRGHCTRTSRRFAKEYRSTIDWSIESTPLENSDHITLSEYDSLGRLVQITDRSGSTTRKSFNLNGCLDTLKWKAASNPNWQIYVGKISYSADLQPIRIDYGNGTHMTHEYDDQTRRVIATKVWTDSRKLLKDARYTYDCLGKVSHIEDGAQPTEYFDGSVVSSARDYTYDSLGQLIRAEGRERLDVSNGGKNPFRPYHAVQNFQRNVLPGNGKSMARYIESYDYDLAGNIISMVHEAADGAVISRWSRKYFYEEPSILEPKKMSNRLSRCKVGNKQDRCHYDLQGCLVSTLGCSMMNWDYDDKLKSSSSQIAKRGLPETTYYRYDHMGKRVRKVVDRPVVSLGTARKRKEVLYLNSCDVLTLYKGDGQTQRQQKTTCQIVGNNTVALVEDSLVRYQTSDSLELDGSGNIVSYEEYSPYGSTTFMAYGKDITAPRKYRFASYERDYETGLYFCNARYYAAWLCRWISPDPLGTIDSNNLYKYCSNDPINYDDPNGTNDGLKPLADDSTSVARPTRPMKALEDNFYKYVDMRPRAQTVEQPRVPLEMFNGAQFNANSGSLSLRPGALFKSGADKVHEFAQAHKQDVASFAKGTQAAAKDAVRSGYDWLDVDQYRTGKTPLGWNDFGNEVASGAIGGMAMGAVMARYVLSQSRDNGKATWGTGARENYMAPSRISGLPIPLGNIVDSASAKITGREYIEKNILKGEKVGPTRSLITMGKYGALGFVTGELIQRAMVHGGFMKEMTPGVTGWSAWGFGQAQRKF
ncbi:hypothetical protein ABW20_dc0102625 [Dactylellina cionopaga]|nr:hypothetical protein ABW20_dc0102625 [Dactylellina cionopaga]